MSGRYIRVDVTTEKGTARQVFAAAEALWIGRDDACDIQLVSSRVSRKHASLELTAEGIRVTDASANGTVVNGLPLRKAARILSCGGGVLRVGPYRVHVTQTIDESARADVEPIDPTKAPNTPPGHVSGATLPATTAPPPESDSRLLTPPVADVGTRREIHRRLLEQLDLQALDRKSMDPEIMRPKVIAALRRIVVDLGAEIEQHEVRETLVQELADEALGLGPLEKLLADVDVSEIMVVDAHTIFAEAHGKMRLTGLRFTDDDAVRAVIERIVTPLGRRIDESSPLVDARLRDGSRVNAVIPPLALKGPCITIRKFAKDPLRMADLERFGSVTPQMARFLERSVKVRKNIIISGGTGSGKTTLLNVLSGAIPSHERIVSVEDAAELQLAQPHVVSLESRPPNLEGKGEYSIRDLVKNALRMRPDRIVVGECRGAEAIDMLQAMNTGHDGSLTTTHANSPKEAVARIETLCLMAGLDLPLRAIRHQIASSVQLFVQQTRFSDGSRRVTSIAEVLGIDDDGEVELREIFAFKVKATRGDGTVEGAFVATGYLPSFLDQFMAHGLVQGEAFL